MHQFTQNCCISFVFATILVFWRRFIRISCSDLETVECILQTLENSLNLCRFSYPEDRERTARTSTADRSGNRTSESTLSHSKILDPAVHGSGRLRLCCGCLGHTVRSRVCCVLMKSEVMLMIRTSKSCVVTFFRVADTPIFGVYQRIHSMDIVFQEGYMAYPGAQIQSRSLFFYRVAKGAR